MTVDLPTPMFLTNKKGAMFHPDFINCGACVACNDDDEEKGNVYADIELAQKNSDVEGELTTKIYVEKLHASQTDVIQTVLLSLPGIKRISLVLEESTISIDHDNSANRDQMADTLKNLGYSAILKENNANQANQSVRSQLYVQGICCASECPSINKIVKPIVGVSKVQINIATKMVHVQHEPEKVTADEIALKLLSQGFSCCVYKDGENELSVQSASVGRTTLHINVVMSKKDVDAIQKQLGFMTGVKRVGVNVTEGIVYVEHDVGQIKANRLQSQLQPFYANSVAMDGQDELVERASSGLLMVAPSKFVESTLSLNNFMPDHVQILEQTFRQNYIPAKLRAFYPHLPSKTVKVEHDPSMLKAEAIADLLQSQGIEAVVTINGDEEGLILPLMEDYDTPVYGGMTPENNSGLRLNVILSGLFWFVSILSFMGDEDSIWKYLKYAGLLSVLFGLPPVALKAFRTIRRCEFDANCMMVTAAIGALLLGEFDEAASVAFLFSVSEYLESKASARARKALASIVSLRPDHANVIHPDTGDIIISPAEKVPVGSFISVRTGDKIAADGVVIEGESSVDESSLTGEAIPVVKKVNDTVAGGSINIGETRLIVKTTCSVEDSAVSRLIRLVEEAQMNRSPTEKLVDTFARVYTPIVVFMALIMVTVPWLISADLGREWCLKGLIIIVIACPCALTISTPVTYAAGLAATAQKGIIVRGGASLEALGSVEKVIFDKTGTLTKGKFVLSQLHTVGEHLIRQEMLEFLHLMESPSSHPLSDTLIRAVREEGVKNPKHRRMTNHTVLKGEGVKADVDGEQVYVGNKRLFLRLGMYETLGTLKDQVEKWSNNGGTVGFIGIERKGIVGVFCVTDAVRSEARDVVRSLREGGIEVIMLTGDGEGAANSVAKQIDLPEDFVHSQLLPEDKLHFVGSLIQPTAKRFATCTPRPRVMMVGDGINDAPALAVADVGVAMGEGATLAIEMSDITLMDCNLSKLLFTMQIGTRVVITIQENILLSLIAKLLIVGFTFANKMTLLLAIAADVGVMLMVTLNGMKLLPKRQIFEEEGATKRIGLHKPYSPVRKKGYSSGVRNVTYDKVSDQKDFELI